MQYIHVRSLEKYNPNYKDRNLVWGKIYFRMVHGDPDCEIVDEINWGRLIKLILLELEAHRPLPLDEAYLAKKGFDLKKCPISNTLLVLQNFITVVTDNGESPYPREEKRREDKSSVTPSLQTGFKIPSVAEISAYCQERENCVDAQRFYDFYEAKGWMVGKNKMKDWKACVRTWERSPTNKKGELIEHPI